MRKIVFIFCLFAFTSCDTELLLTNKDRKYAEQLQGDWKIMSLKSERIQKDGVVKPIFDINQGSISFLNCNAAFCDFNYTGLTRITGVDGALYTNIMPNSGAAKSDEAVKRVVFLQAECPSAIGCDRNWTIEKNEAKAQIWSAYYIEAAGTHRKLTLSISK